MRVRSDKSQTVEIERERVHDQTFFFGKTPHTASKKLLKILFFWFSEFSEFLDMST